jgi:DNA-binding MarR family transcriptional regulator
MTASQPDTPRRLSLLYQVWLLENASSRFMRLALRGTGMRAEEYGFLSYLFANGPRTLTQSARDLGHPLTTLATILTPLVDAGDVERRAHPQDRRAKLLDLTEQGRRRIDQAAPRFSSAYRALMGELEAASVDPDAVYDALEQLRSSIERTIESMEQAAGSRAAS